MTDFPSFPSQSDRQIVYVRAVKATDLPREIRDQVGGRAELYAIHAQTGEVLALVPNRAQAFVVARQNELAPVSVH